MTKPKPCPPAPGPLEGYAAHFDDLFSHLAQRRGFREYLTGLLAPRDRNKTLTCLAGAEPVAGAGHPAVQRLQFFLTESCWDPDRINARRLRLLTSDPASAPHEDGAMVIDDSGDRKDGTATAFTARQWLGRLGKTDNGVVTVTSLWADERLYYPLHAVPYTPAARLPGGTANPAFRTKPAIAADLSLAATQAGIAFRAVVADCFYGDNDAFTAQLHRAHLPYVLALKPHKGTWAPADAPHTPVDAARALAFTDAEHPGDWTPVVRTFRDGHTQRWWAAEASLGPWGPDRPTRLVVATTDPATLPKKNTWYLITNLPRPSAPHAAHSPHRPADLAEVVRLYGLRTWVEQSYKQVKDELGWADFQVRSAKAIRRHQTLVNCAFSFCWANFLTQHDGHKPTAEPEPTAVATAGERGATKAGDAQLAEGPARGAQLVDPSHRADTLVAILVECAPAD
jgi:SRSO17 transposase